MRDEASQRRGSDLAVQPEVRRFQFDGAARSEAMSSTIATAVCGGDASSAPDSTH